MEDETPEKGRAHRLYRATAEGSAVHRQWLSQPVEPATVGNDLGLHLMRFAMMEQVMDREQVITFLADLADALEAFVSGLEHYLATMAAPRTPHVTLALEHGIAVHRASLEWARSAIKTLRAAASETR